MATEQALLLRRYRYGESSLVVHAFTRGSGRAHLLAKGAYRLSSGYCGVLDYFDTLELSWRARPADLLTLTGARVLERRKALSLDLARYRAALGVLELLDLTCPGPPEPRAFDLACRTLDDLGDPERSTEWVVPTFDLRLLSVLGLAPSLETCAACAGPAPAVDRPMERAAFSAGAGGRLCLACAHEARASARRVGTLPVRVLEIAGQLLLAGRPGGDVPEALRGEVRDFVRRFLEYHLETRPRSRQAPHSGRRPGRRAGRRGGRDRDEGRGSAARIAPEASNPRTSNPRTAGPRTAGPRATDPRSPA